MKNQLQDFFEYAAGRRYFYSKVQGDCLTGEGILDGDMIKVDLWRMPKPPKYLKRDGESYCDCCLCYGTMDPDECPDSLLVKTYNGVAFGRQQVATSYGDWQRINFSFMPQLILGVVCAVYDDKNVLKWERDTENHPRSLGTKNTVECEGLGDAIMLEVTT